MANTSTVQSVKESIARIVGADALLAMENSGRLVVTRSDLLDPDCMPQVGRNSTAAVSRMVRNQGFALHLARIRQAKQRAIAAIGQVDDCAIVRSTHREAWQMILADASEPGKWRIQSFDARGFSGHMVFNDKQEAIECAAANGYTERDDGALDRIFDTPAFQRGLFCTDLVRRINMAELSFEQANAELARYDEAQMVLASVAGMGAQAFVGGKGRVMVILADRIKAGDESAVFLHEVTHKWGREVMPTGDWQRLVGRVKSWSNRPSQSIERQIHDRAHVRVSAAWVKSSLHDEEFFAYAVEEAVKLGVKPSAAALEDSAEAWLQQVVDTLERTLLAATEASQIGRLGVSGFPEDLQQLVDLAYAMAQLESPSRSSKIWQRLSAEQQDRLNQMLESQGLARISEEIGTFNGSNGFFTPARSALRGIARDLDGAKASEWLKFLKKEVTRAGLDHYLSSPLSAHAGLEYWLAALGSTRLSDDLVLQFDEHGVSFRLVGHVGGFGAVVGQEPVNAVLRTLVPPAKGLVDVGKLTVRSTPNANGGRTLQVVSADLFDTAARLQVAKGDLQQFESRLRELYGAYLHESSWRASDDKTANLRLANQMASMTPMIDIAEHYEAREQYLSLVDMLQRAQQEAQDLDAGSGWADVVIFRVLSEAAVHGFDSVELPLPLVSSAVNASLKGLVDAKGAVHLTPDVSGALLAGLPHFDLGHEGDAASSAWYFSKLERALGCVPKRLEGSSGRQWSDWLKGNRLGVKQQEIHWSGILEWLNLQDGLPVYAQQVIAFVKANGVRVHESVLSEDGADSLFFKPFRDMHTGRWVVHDNSDRMIASFDSKSEASEFIARYQYPSQRTLMEHIRSAGLKGTGYRELLLTLGGTPANSNKGFSSSEWDADLVQPLGVLAHVRMDEQVGVNGGRLLMVHEVRSEWSQALASQARMGGDGIGDMPFAKPQDWLALVTKRLLVLAAQEGFDGVAIASGQLVIEQNPLFKGLTGLHWMPAGLPSTQTPLVGGTLIGVGVNGERLWSRDVERPGAIAHYVGTRLAKELLASGSAGIEAIARARESVIDVYDRQIPRAMKHALALVEGEAAIGTVHVKQAGGGEILLHGFEMTAHLKEVLGDGVAKVPLFSTNDGFLKTPTGDARVVYHGVRSVDVQRQNPRLHGLLFSTASVAAKSGLGPHVRDTVEVDMTPGRVLAANLVMRRPVINTPDDPFMQFRDLVASIGQERAVVLAKRYAEYIEPSSAWVDEGRFDGGGGVVAHLNNNPSAVLDLYVDAKRILEDEEALDWLLEAGYDGAVYGGDGAGEVYYRVFSSEQVVPIWSSDALLPPEPSIDARLAAFLDYWKDREDGLPPYDEACRFAGHLLGEYARSQGVLAEFQVWAPYGSATGIELTDLVATEPGNGAGSKVMQQLGAVADRLGLGVYLRPSDSRVREFYVRHGYETASKNFFGFMVRYPSVDSDDDDGPFDGPGRARGALAAPQHTAQPTFSFAGEKAQDAPMASLHLARARLAQGENAQAVRAQTGWFVGADGRWRFEIDDASAKLKPLSEAAQRALSQYGKVHVVLADVIDHPRLLHAYSALASMPVELVQNRSGGLYLPGMDREDPGEIVIGAFLRQGAWELSGISGVLHEVQHAIQRREGFAVGGTPSIQAWASGALRPHLIGQTQALVSEMKPPSYEAYWGEDHSAEGEAAYAEFLKDWHSPDYQRQLWQASQQGAAARVYERLAGEVEARDVQRRMGLSAAQRLAAPPALSAGGDGLAQDLVIVFNGQEMDNASGLNAAPVSLPEVRAIWTTLGIEHYVTEQAGRIHLSQIVVPKHLRGQGLGTQAMQALVDYADASGQRLELSPSTDFGATSKARLQRFYRRFGFVANQGSRRDFTTMEAMLREPKSVGFMDLRPNPERQELRTYKVGDTTMVLSVSPFEPGVVHLSSLRTPVTKRGKGSARAAMQALLAQADGQGVSINLTASALDRKTNQTGLRMFYRSLGFEDTGRRMNAWGHPEMVRHAQPQKSGEHQIPEMLEVDGVIRPTRNSRGMLIHTKLQAIEQFWRWYAGQGEPALLDADGRPLVLYHGTNQDLERLDPVRERTAQSVHAVFATDDQKVASEFALYRSVWPGANVLPIYARTGRVLRIEGRGKPIRTVESDIDTARLAAWSMTRRGDMAGVERVWSSLEAVTGVDLSGMDLSIDETLRSYAKRMGFDAVVFNEVTDDVGPEMGRASNIHVLLDPVSIKSATGNLGTYDPWDESLRLSVAQQPMPAEHEGAESQEPLAQSVSQSQPNLLGLPKASVSMQWLATGVNDIGPAYRGHGIELHAVAEIKQDDFDLRMGFARFGLMGHAARCMPGTRTYAFKVVQPGTHKVMGALVSDVDQDGHIVSIHDIAAVVPGKGHGTRVVAHLLANAPDNRLKVQEISNGSEEFWQRLHIGYIDTYRDAYLEESSVLRSPALLASAVHEGIEHRTGVRAAQNDVEAQGTGLDLAATSPAREVGGQGTGEDAVIPTAPPVGSRLGSGHDERSIAVALEADSSPRGDLDGLDVSDVGEADLLAFADDLGLDFARLGRRWVKDARGVDLKVYHGTSAVFSEFGSNPRGIFFAEDKGKARSFSAIRKGGCPRVIEARINVNKVWEVIRYAEDVPYAQMVDQSVVALKAQGYDAMHCPDDGVWIVFNPSQVDILRDDIDAQSEDSSDEFEQRLRAQMQSVRDAHESAEDWLKAPNGNRTNLSRRQWLMVRTDSFKRWFGDWQGDPQNASKALDGNGEPKVYHHGTPEGGFTDFWTEGSGKTQGTGVFFAADPRMARGYSNGSSEAPIYLPEQIFNQPDLIEGLEIEKGVLVSTVVSSKGRKAWSWFSDQQQARQGLELADGDLLESKPGYRVLVDGYEECVGDKQTILDHLTDLKSKQAGIYECFLNVRDLVVVDWKGKNWDEGPQEDVWEIEDEMGALLDWAYSPQERDAILANNPGAIANHRLQSVYDTSDDAARQAREMGANGILIRDIWDTGPAGYVDDGDVMVVFDKNDIKWADNIGSFDASNSDIRFSIPAQDELSVEQPQLLLGDGKKPLTLKPGKHNGYFDAYVGERRVGAICAWEDSRGEFVVMDVMVSAPYRRRGVATAMYRAVEAQAGRLLKPAVSLSDDGFEFWKAYRPEAVADDLRHRLGELIGRRGVKGGREGIITKASGGTATLTYPDGMHSTILRRELEAVLLPLAPDDGPGGPRGTPSPALDAEVSEAEHGDVVNADDGSVDTLTGSPAFRAWFKDSKVVGADGDPLVVYHGTYVRDHASFDDGAVMGDIASFDRLFTTRFRSPSIDTLGCWFSTNPGEGGAKMYGDTIYPVYLSIKNPLVTTFRLMERRARLLENGQDDGRKIGEREVDAYRKWLAALGKDGIKIEGSGNEGSTEFDSQEVWIALEPTQIKSAIGNNGNFDGNSPDIRLSIPGPLVQHNAEPILSAHILRGLGELNNDVDYAAGKSGNIEAAYRTASRFIDQHVVDLVKGIDSPIILGVASIEASGRNRVPVAAASVLSHLLGASFDASIVQTNSPKRTSMDGLGRIFNRPEFGGDVQSGRNYVLIDDTITQGATFAALARFIQESGGIVSSIISLSGKQYSAKITPDQSLVEAVRAKFGDVENEFKDATGHGFEQLTQSEARYLVNFKPASAVRDRILAQRFTVNPSNGEDFDERTGKSDLISVLQSAHQDEPADIGAGPARGIFVDDVPQFSFAGPQALTANPFARKSAQTRLMAGEDGEVVRRETGWFEGVDGQLRFEIDDSQAFAKGTLAFGELVMRWYHTGVERTGDRLYKVRVQDILYHPALFAAYPSLADLEVQMMPPGLKARGRLVIEDGAPSIIQINELLQTQQWVSVMLHELQHAVQEIENFERGTSTEKFDGTRDPSLGDEVLRKEIYRLAAGEVEARNVQARQGLSAEERVQIPPHSTQDVSNPRLLGRKSAAHVQDMDDGVIRLARAQIGGDHLRASSGEAGRGVYAYFPKDSAMRAYYGSDARAVVWNIEVDATRLVDLTSPKNMSELLVYARAQFAQLAKDMPGYVKPVVSARNIQRFGRIIEGFVREHRPWAGAWVVPHHGPGLPSAKQVVIADDSAVLSAVAQERRNDMRLVMGDVRYEQALQARSQELPLEKTMEAVSSDSPNIVFHVTPASNVAAILGKGIHPGIGPRSAACGELVSRSYHFVDAQALRTAATGWLMDAFDEEPLALMAVDISGLSVESSSAGFEVQVLECIDPSRLQLVHRQVDLLTVNQLAELAGVASRRLSIRRVAALTAERGDGSFSFGGVRARTADLVALNHGKIRNRLGSDVREIWSSQGWMLGGDGKWRFELDDSNAAVDVQMLRNIDQGEVCDGMPEVKRIVYRQFVDGHGQECFDLTLIPPQPKVMGDIASFTGLRTDVVKSILGADLLAKMRSGQGEEDLIGPLYEARGFDTPGLSFGGFNALPLDLVLDHPALFEAYPQLRDVLVTVNPNMEAVAAFVIQDCVEAGRTFERRLIRMKSTRMGRDQLLSALMHEVQHAIQEIEGFAPGGNVVTAANHDQRMRYLMTEQALARVYALKDKFPGTYKAYNDMQVHFFASLASHGIQTFGPDGALRDLMTLTRELRVCETPYQSQRRHQLVEIYRQWMDRELGDFGSPGQCMWAQAINALTTARMRLPESPQEVYRKLAGEVEARNVQMRLQFPAHKRLETLPTDTEDVVPTDQIYIEQPQH